MGILNRLFGKAPKQNEPGGSGAAFVWQHTGTLPPPRNAADILASYSTTSKLRRDVDKIGEAFGALSWEIGYYTDSNTKARTRSSVAKSMSRALRVSERSKGFESLPSHPLLDLLGSGNPQLDGQTVMALTCMYLDVKGEAFWFLDFGNGSKTPLAIWPIPPSQVADVPTGRAGVYTIRTNNGQQIAYSQEQIIWFKTPNLLDPYGRGVGLAEVLSEEIEVDQYARSMSKALFWNRGVPSVIVSFAGMGEKEVLRAEAEYRAQFSGVRNQGKAKFTNAPVDVKQLTQTNEQMQLTETRKSIGDGIDQAFGLPPEIGGKIENSNRATIDAADLIMGKYVTTPRAERVRLTLQNRLVPLFDERLVLEYTSPVTDDREYKLKVMTAAPDRFTRADWRATAGLDFDPIVDAVYPDPTPTIGLSSPPRGLGQGNGVSKAFDQAWAARVLKEIKGVPMEDTVPEIIDSDVQAWGQRTMRKLGVGADFATVSQRFIDYMAASGELIAGIDDTTLEEVRVLLTQAIAEGAGAAEIARLLRAKFAEYRNSRAMAIARTEAHSASNFATIEAYRQSGVVVGKRWVAQPDARTREAHAVLGGAEVGLDEAFKAGGVSAMQPGGFGVPELDINCRCSIRPILEGDEPGKYAGEDEAVWKAYDRLLTQSEKRLAKAVRGVFADQLDAALGVL